MKRPVLALHPSLAHGGAFAALAAALPDADITAPDMIGHGRAPAWDGYSDLHSACTRDALMQAEALAKASGGPIDLIGHSFGATLALRMALERPELLRSIVLIEPVLFAAARADGAPEYRAFATEHALFAALLDSGDLQAAAGEFQRHWGDGQDFDGLPAAIRAYITHRLPLIVAQSAGLVEDSGGMLGYGRLESCPLPILLLRGTTGPRVISAIHRALIARLPNAQETIITGAGHMLPITHAPQAALAIRRFWSL
jgi:lipase